MVLLFIVRYIEVYPFLNRKLPETIEFWQSKNSLLITAWIKDPIKIWPIKTFLLKEIKAAIVKAHCSLTLLNLLQSQIIFSSNRKILLLRTKSYSSRLNIKGVFGSNEFHKILWNLFANPHLCVWFKSIFNEIHFQF